MGEKKSVLIVEDNGMTGEILQSVIEASGRSAVLCQDAATALKMVGKRTFDMLIADYRMPDMAGSEVVKAAHRCSPRPYIIGISVDPKREQEFIAAGADAFMLKPFGIDNLLDLIKRRNPRKDRT